MVDGTLWKTCTEQYKVTRFGALKLLQGCTRRYAVLMADSVVPTVPSSELRYTPSLNKIPPRGIEGLLAIRLKGQFHST
jgi:hypothetical protein